MLHPISGPKSIKEINLFAIGSFIDGTHKQIYGFSFPFYHFVGFFTHIASVYSPKMIHRQADVQDVARSHVDALTNPSAPRQRVLLISAPQLVANTIGENFPQLRDRVPEGNPSQHLPPGVHPTEWDIRVSLDVLAKGNKEGKWEYRALETSHTDTVRSMIESHVI